jgi:hypothetical protein
MAPWALPLGVPALIVCPHCNVHIKLGEGRCPHCDGALALVRPAAGLTATALLLGLSLSGCTGKKPPQDLQVEYGVPHMDDDTVGDVDRPDAKADDSKRPDAKSNDPAPPQPLPAEPEYGLPEVDEVPPAPAYGVAEPLPADPPPPARP